MKYFTIQCITLLGLGTTATGYGRVEVGEINTNCPVDHIQAYVIGEPITNYANIIISVYT